MTEQHREHILSIVIPTLNEAGHIAATITALRARADKPERLQLIVADGGSTDGTVAAARSQGAAVCPVDQACRAVQMNAGAKMAEGELLYFLHADTRPPPRFDHYIRRSLRQGTGAGCFRLSFDSSSRLLRFYSWWTRFDVDAFRFGDQSLFARRTAFESVGGFREDHRLLEDHDIVRRIKRRYAFQLHPAKVVTSARKYRRNGTFRLQVIYLLIFVLYKLGLAQSGLILFYKKWVQ